MNYELNWLKYFYEVARLGSVTSAAKQLKISQPAVTKTIRTLENGIEVKLFEKHGRNLVLTDEGRALLEVCKKTFTTLEGIRDVKNTSTDQLKGKIRIGASDHICYYVLPKLVSLFSDDHPDLSWEFFSGVSSEIKNKLIAGEIDAGVFYTKLNLKEQIYLKETKLGEVEFAVVISSKWSKKLKSKKIELENLKNINYIGARASDYSGTLAEQWIYKRLGLEPNVLIEANTKEMQKKMILNGMGYAVLPLLMIKDELKSGRLEQVKTPNRLFVDVLWVENKASTSGRATRLFKEKFLKPHFTSS